PVRLRDHLDGVAELDQPAVEALHPAIEQGVGLAALDAGRAARRDMHVAPASGTCIERRRDPVEAVRALGRIDCHEVRAQGGSAIAPARTAARTSCGRAPANGRLAHSASHSATQNANWSLRASTTWPAHCSADMYAGVPTALPRNVALLSKSASPARSPSSSPAVPTTRPKSHTRGLPSLPIRTLSGLKS